MATYNPVSPTELYRLISGAAAARRKPDYYGIGATLGGVGDAYDAMNRSVVTANQAQTSTAQTNARMDAGYYPAQVAGEMAGMEQKAYDTNAVMTRKKEIEAAHREAAQMGLKGNTPQYDMFMRDKLSQGSFASAQEGEKFGTRGIASLQTAQVGTANIKRQIEDKLRAKFATDEFVSETVPKLQNTSMSKEERAVIVRNGWMSALQKAKQRVINEEIKINYDHENRMYTAIDGQQRVVEIPDNFLAPNYAAGGNTGPAKSLEAEFKKMLDFERQQELARKTSPLDPVSKTTAKPEKPVKQQLDPEVAEMYKDLRDLRKHRTTLARAKKEDRDEASIKELDAEIKELKDQLYGVPGEPEKGAGLDINSLISKVTTSPNLGLVPDDLQQKTQPISQPAEPEFETPSMFGTGA